MTDEILDFLEQLVKIRSVKAVPRQGMPYGENSAEVLAVFLKKAHDMGFKTKNFDNYVGTVESGEGEPKLGILCHLDVVPEGEDWSYPPYELTNKDGTLYGRGTFDDKGPAVAALFALYEAKKHGLKENVRLILGCDEECGSDDLKYYEKCEPLPNMLFSPDADFPVVNGEMGIIHAVFKNKIADGKISEISSGSASNAVPAKANAVLSDGTTVFAEGKSAHASTPQEGENAAVKLLDKLKDCSEDIKRIAEKFPCEDFYGKSLGIDSEDEVFGKLTATLTKLSLSDGVLCGTIDIRYPPSTTLERISKVLENTFETVEIEGNNPHFVDPKSDFVKSLLEAYEEVTGQKGYTVTMGGGTYVHDTVGGVAFGMSMPGTNNNIHGADEFITVDELLRGIEIFKTAIIKICG